MDNKNQKGLSIDQISECNQIKNHNIVYLMFTSNQKCIVFVKDKEEYPTGGPLKAYLCNENFGKDSLRHELDIKMKFDYLKGDLTCVF